MKLNKVDIGAEIEARLNHLNLSKSEFGRKIGIPQQNVNRILEKSSIDTDRLLHISTVLKFNFFKLFFSDPIEHYEAHGEHGFVAKHIDHVDNREVIDISDKDEFTEIEEVSEKIILPQNCSKEAVHTVEKLTLKVNMLQQLLAEKNERIEEYKERIKELKGK